MTLKLQYEHMAHVVGMACELADHDLVDELAAILWTARNCLERSGAEVTIQTVTDLCCRLHKHSGCRNKDPRKWDKDGFGEPVYCRVFGVFCSVLASDVPDVSNGALRFHRHDSVPAWSRRSEPSALIGRYFFFNDPSLWRPLKGALRQHELGLACA